MPQSLANPLHAKPDCHDSLRVEALLDHAVEPGWNDAGAARNKSMQGKSGPAR